MVENRKPRRITEALEVLHLDTMTEQEMLETLTEHNLIISHAEGRRIIRRARAIAARKDKDNE